MLIIDEKTHSNEEDWVLYSQPYDSFWTTYSWQSVLSIAKEDYAILVYGTSDKNRQNESKEIRWMRINEAKLMALIALNKEPLIFCLI